MADPSFQLEVEVLDSPGGGGLIDPNSEGEGEGTNLLLWQFFQKKKKKKKKKFMKLKKKIYREGCASLANWMPLESQVQNLSMHCLQIIWWENRGFRQRSWGAAILHREDMVQAGCD